MSILTFPNGQKVEVEFDEQAHTYVRRFELSGGVWSEFQPTHGITAPLAVVPKEFLKVWAAKESVIATLKRVYDVPKLVDDLEQFFIDLDAKDRGLRTPDNKPVMSDYRFKKAYPWYSGLSMAHKSKAKESTDIGTWLHSAIEHYYKSDRKDLPIITPGVEPVWQSFITFDNFYKPKADADGLEFIVYSMMFGYSGQGDFRGQMSNKTVILDWKTTNRSYNNPDGISVEYFFQVGGLAHAEFERTGVWVDDVGIVNLDKEGGDPRVIMASEFGMSPRDCGRAYISCFNTYHTVQDWDYKYLKK